MHRTLTTLINRLDDTAILGADVIMWGCPVPSFGDLSRSWVATLGLNPSNREFVDGDGDELKGELRRFHTLSSLGIDTWADVDARHLHLILESCRTYFTGNPYDRWFRRLNHVVSGTKASFYDAPCTACHLDLIPYATARKWTDLSSEQRAALLSTAADTLGLLLRDSHVRVLILNGQSVVNRFQDICGVRLNRQAMTGWSLRRRGKPEITGFAYSGFVGTIAGVELQHQLLVLGYNHNLQSSFGVTSAVVDSIRQWVSDMTQEIDIETA